MFNKTINLFDVDLQLFSEGGGEGTGATGADAASQTGGNTPDAGVKNAESEKHYSESEMQNIIKQRVKSKDEELNAAKEAADKYSKAAPLLEMIAQKYGAADASDIDAITKAVNDDSSFFEEAALEAGMSVEKYKEFNRIKREHSAMKSVLDQQERQKKIDAQTQKWMREAEETAAKYESFDLSREMQNPRFKEKLLAGDTVTEAYQALHFDELMSSAMKYSAEATKKDVAADIMARGARPNENGLSSQSSATVKEDISNMSRNSIFDVMKRAERGEKINFR